MKTSTFKEPGTLIGIVFVVFAFFLLAYNVLGEPVGVKILDNSTDNGPTYSYNRADDGGTITTAYFNVSQQSAAWKGYVGNVTGQLQLQDSDNISLYDWTFSTISGEVYASRGSSVTWASIACAGYDNMSAEYAVINMAEIDADSINKTFASTSHSQFVVAGTTITNSTCPSMATNINGSSQTVSEAADFQEVLLYDEANLVYTTILEQDTWGYRNGTTYDFQMIIPDSDAAATQTTYYFYAELG